MLNFKFKILYFVTTILICSFIAWLVSINSEINWMMAFLFLAIGLPILSFLEKLKNIPSYLVSAYLMRKELVKRIKNQLQKLDIKTAEDWIAFQEFYDDDLAIGNYVEKNPKAFTVGTRYNIQGLRDGGNFVSFLINGLVCSKALEEMFWEIRDREQYEFVKSEGYESWAEYMVENGIGEDIRESYKEEAQKEKEKRLNRVN